MLLNNVFMNPIPLLEDFFRDSGESLNVINFMCIK